MAKIESQEVINKVIDGLRLDVGNEKIPQEVEDKLRAVFISNPSRIIKVASGSATDSTSGPIFTTHATKRTFLVSLQLTVSKSALATSINSRISAFPFGESAAIVLVRINYEPLTAGNHILNTDFSIPIRLEPNTAVAIINTTAVASIDTAALAFFYEEEL